MPERIQPRRYPAEPVVPPWTAPRRGDVAAARGMRAAQAPRAEEVAREERRTEPLRRPPERLRPEEENYIRESPQLVYRARGSISIVA
jgi:hypothetical protein